MRTEWHKRSLNQSLINRTRTSQTDFPVYNQNTVSLPLIITQMTIPFKFSGATNSSFSIGDKVKLQKSVVPSLNITRNKRKATTFS